MRILPSWRVGRYTVSAMTHMRKAEGPSPKLEISFNPQSYPERQVLLTHFPEEENKVPMGGMTPLPQSRQPVGAELEIKSVFLAPIHVNCSF